MEKNTIIIIFVVILILLGISIGVFFMMKKSKSIIAPTASTPSPSSTNIRPTDSTPSTYIPPIDYTPSTYIPPIDYTPSTYIPPTDYTNWSILKIDNSYIVARKNSSGDAEALYNDATNILWYSSEKDAAQALSNSTLSNMKPLACGETHKSVHGVTGYDDPSHWCTQLRAPLGLPPTAPVPSTYITPSAPAPSLTNWAGNSYHTDGETCGPTHNNTACTGNRCCSTVGLCGGNTGGDDDWCNYYHGFEGKYDDAKPPSGPVQLKQIKWGDTDKCFDVDAGKNENGTAIKIWSCDKNNNNQKFKYENGQIKWGDTGKCFDVDGGDFSNGKQIKIWNCDPSKMNQRFKYENGIFKAAFTDKCLDVDGGKNENGTQIKLWTCDKTKNNQKFNFLTPPSTNWAGNLYHTDGATCGPKNNNTACTGNRCCSEYGMCGGTTGGNDDWCNKFHGFEGKYDSDKPQQGKEGKLW
jgi:hypothetical protein